MPPFLTKDTWAFLTRFLKTDSDQIFPLFECRGRSLKLCFALVALYNGKHPFEWGDFKIILDGKEAEISVVHGYSGRLEHCYLTLTIAGEVWIIDSSYFNEL